MTTKHAKREKEVAQVVISKEDVELIVKEMEISKTLAEKSLRENRGSVVEALTALVNSWNLSVYWIFFNLHCMSCKTMVFFGLLCLFCHQCQINNHLMRNYISSGKTRFEGGWVCWRKPLNRLIYWCCAVSICAKGVPVTNWCNGQILCCHVDLWYLCLPIQHILVTGVVSDHPACMVNCLM